MNELINELINECMNEWMHEWMNECISRLGYPSRLDWPCCSTGGGHECA